MTEQQIQLRAVRTLQADGIDVYAFFIPGNQITQVADISRIHRDENDTLEGFQRKEIKQHVKSIADYIDQGPVLFPNSITLAFSDEVTFRQSRGREPEGLGNIAQSGTLSIPLREEGKRAAWIVDGQQRSLALAKAKNKELNVPVVAFVATDLEMQREQFILVNKAKPLPSRLINELLPEVQTELPRDLAVRKIPSALCDLLNVAPSSPFYELIRRMSNDANPKAVVVDTAIINMIKTSIRNPLGVLSQYKSLGQSPSNTGAMFDTLVMFWREVKNTFPDAWGLPPEKSRLMHSAGIHGMGVLMDRIMTRASSRKNPQEEVRRSLHAIAPHCRWTHGVWEELGMEWNELQSVSKHLRLLADLMVRLDYEAARDSES